MGSYYPAPSNDGPFREGLARHELWTQACARCATPRLPARTVCAQCSSREHGWRRTSGAGTVEALIWYLRRVEPVPSSIRRDPPYNVVAVAVDDGPCVLATVTGTEYGVLRIGDRVTFAGGLRDGIPDLTFRRIDPRETLT